MSTLSNLNYCEEAVWKDPVSVNVLFRASVFFLHCWGPHWGTPTHCAVVQMAVQQLISLSDLGAFQAYWWELGSFGMVLARVPMGTGAIGGCGKLHASWIFCSEVHDVFFLSVGLQCCAAPKLTIHVVFYTSWIFVAPHTDWAPIYLNAGSNELTLDKFSWIWGLWSDFQGFCCVCAYLSSGHSCSS